uniref:hypothetical protein n=1 Tax=Clostridium sp. NkU-1 TaxID=1095009 RepID=UPI0006D0E54D
MKKKVILLAAALLCGCLLAGCQKTKGDQLNPDTVTTEEGQIKVESSNETNEEKEKFSIRDISGRKNESYQINPLRLN